MKGIQTYRKQAVTFSTNEDLVLRLFERALLKMWEGHMFLSENDKTAAVGPLQVSRQIICELLGCLDYEDGGEIASSLNQLYIWLLKEISRSGFEGDPDMLEGAIEVLDNIYSGFRDAFEHEAKG
jgi:flagellar secretion chaperone FliS